ncbi:MAG: DUF805 domain-containing protein [Alphaproteobacteria bacterium]|nr:DUF805 domain-containing protein [Alphaproteobacteria bacterium]
MRNKVLQVFAGLYALAVWSIPAISAAQGQLSPEDLKAFEATMAEAQGAASLVVYAIQFVISLVMFGIGAIILLIARKDMRGWSQPVKDVWFSFDGRLNRKAYWLKGTIGLGMVGCVVNMVSVLFTLPILMFLGPTSILLGLAGLAVWLPYVVFQFWTALAIMYKRCHDRGRSAWWLLLVIVPLLNLWVMIELLFLRGTVGPNKFGADPIDPNFDYIDAMFGGKDESQDGEDAERPRPHPRPAAAEPSNNAKGFGARKFGLGKATAPAPVAQPEARAASPDLPGGEGNLDLIKKRLGDDILRPIGRPQRGEA